MSNFGDRLRREREKRKTSLDDVATATKISKRHLSELEEERFKDLPGGIFNKGFVRAYAKFLELDEEEMVRAFVASEAAAMGETTPPVAMETQKLMASMAVAKEQQESVRRYDPAARLMTFAVATVLVLGVGAFAYRYYEEQKHTGTAKAAESTPESAPAMKVEAPKPQAPAENATTSTEPADAASQAPSAAAASGSQPEAARPQNGVFVELHAKAESWLQVKADGRDPVEMTLVANQSKKFFAEKELVMKFGNAEAIEITQNGQRYPAFAPGTKTRTVTFTPAL
jgi:cytoskeleton protein RodZ